MKAVALSKLALREAWRPLTLALAALLAGIAVDLAAPWPLKIVVDHILLGRPMPDSYATWLAPVTSRGAAWALAAAAVAIALLAIIGGLCAYVQTFLTARVGQTVAHRLRVRAFGNLLRMPLAYHRDERAAELVNRVASDTLIVRDAFADWSLKAAGDALLVVGVLAVMLYLHPVLALLTAVLLPVLYLALRGLTGRIRQLARQQRRQDGALAARMQELLQSIALVQATGTERRELAAFAAVSERSANVGVTTARVTALVSRTVSLVAAAATASIVLLGGHQVLKAQLTPGDLLVFVAYVAALFKPLRDLGKLWAKFARARASVDRLQEILALEPACGSGVRELTAASVRGALQFNSLWFRYRGQDAILKGFTLEVAAGEHVVLLGPSGIGKSSLLRLLARLYSPDSGDIRLDDEPIDNLTDESLHAAIGVVLQETLFVGATVRDNIAYGCDGADESAIVVAARAACAHDFIMRLPQGYDTVIGEQACKLSGGERQRLSLARGLLGNPPVLVLDEPTSAVDADTARAIVANLKSFRAGRTTLVIAHQLPTLASFDRVIELSEGRARELTVPAHSPTQAPVRRAS